MPFGRRPKTASALPSSSSGSPFGSPHSSTTSPSSAQPGYFRLRVAVDPAPLGTDEGQGLFYITVHPEDDVVAIRRAVVTKLGDVAVGLFKVNMPWQAYSQARTYAKRYLSPVHLITQFPAYSLDDPSQLAPSLGRETWSGEDFSCRCPKIRDWWSDHSETDVVSVLVRTLQGWPSTVIPLTLLAHFAPLDPASRRRGSAGHPPAHSAKDRPRPAVVDVSPSATVNELKMVILEADARPTGFFDQVVVWHVEMSEREIVVIEERGGLKGGRMPWPYPPCAPVPTALDDYALPISHYFPDTLSNTRDISFSVWIHPAAFDKLAPVHPAEANDAPTFRYPMPDHELISAEERQRVLITLSPASIATQTLPNMDDTPTPATLPRAANRRTRPHTAPAVSESPSGDGGVHTFGSRSRLALGRSPLGSRDPDLGINISAVTSKPGSPVPTNMSSPSVRSSRSTVSSTGSIDSVPGLDFSQLSLIIEPYPLLTPTDEQEPIMLSSKWTSKLDISAQRKAVQESLFGL